MVYAASPRGIGLTSLSLDLSVRQTEASEMKNLLKSSMMQPKTLLVLSVPVVLLVQ